MMSGVDMVPKTMGQNDVEVIVPLAGHVEELAAVAHVVRSATHLHGRVMRG